MRRLGRQLQACFQSLSIFWCQSILDLVFPEELSEQVLGDNEDFHCLVFGLDLLFLALGFKLLD